MVKSISRVSLICVLVTLAAGCSWFSWLPWVDAPEKKQSEKVKPADLVKFTAEVTVKRLWRAKIGEGLGRKYLKLNPVVVADRVIAADGFGVIEARDRFSGKRVWRTQFDVVESGLLDSFNFWDRRDPSFVSGGVGAGDGLLFVGTTQGEVIAFSASDGAEVWRATVGSEVLSTPVTGDGLVFAQTIDGRLLALEGDSGEVRWSYDNQVPVLTLRGSASPVYQNDIVYAGFANGKVSALRANSGELVWEQRIMLPEGRSELDRMVDVDGTPIVREGVLYAAAFQGRMLALNQRDGQPFWEQKVSSHLDMTVGYGQIYMIDNDDTLHAIDMQSAEPAWQQDALRLRRLSSPTAFSNYVVATDEDGYLHVMAQSDGRFLGRRKVDGDGARSKLVVADGTLYVLGNSGSLSAFDILEK